MKRTVVLCLILGIVSLSAAIPAKTRNDRVMFMRYESSDARVRQINGSSTNFGGNIFEESRGDSDNDDGDSPKTVSSVAEAVDLPIEEDTEFQSNQDVDEPLQFEENDSRIGAKDQRNFELSTNAYEEPAINTTPTNVEAPADKKPIVPVVPVIKPLKRILPPKKKIFVELETPEPESIYVPAVRRVFVKNPNLGKAASARPGSNEAKPSPPIPSGSFFPIDFGKTDSGVIAIANSFSTGQGGSATSTATAYGSSNGVTRSLRARSN